MDMPSSSNDELVALLTLILAGGPIARRRDLLQQCGSAQASIDAGPRVWLQARCTTAQCTALARPDTSLIDRALDWLAGPNRHLLSCQHEDFPALLQSSPWPPLALFIDGDPLSLWQPAIALVGTRAPTAGGRDNARDFAGALATSGLTVSSGLAAGIDAAAHRAALEAGRPSIAVIGTGPDLTYPRHHQPLHEAIAATGAVVSEYPPGTPARAGQFPARNRILAGLTLGTVVIEAAERSGALITARLAADAGREVFALPGSIHNPMVRGCHRLIRQGAYLTQHPEEVIEQLNGMANELGRALRSRLGAPIQSAQPACTPAYAPPDPDYQRLWNALGFDPTGMDSLIERTGLTAAILSSMLLVMELDGRVTVEHGRYCRQTVPSPPTASHDAGRGQ
jgi:DNA processing protein